MKEKLYLNYFMVMLLIFNITFTASAYSHKAPRGETKITVSEESTKEEKPYLKVDLSIPRFIIPSNKAFEQELNKKLYNDAIAFRESVESDALKSYQEFISKGIPVRPYEVVTKYTVHNIKDILSLTVNYYQFTGGAHGIYRIEPYNFDISTGKRLGLKDVFKEGFDFKTAINNEINKSIAKEPQNFFPDAFKSIKDNQEFYITPEGLVVYFQVYDIAPFAAGTPEFLIPFSVLGQGFIDKLAQ